MSKLQYYNIIIFTLFYLTFSENDGFILFGKKKCDMYHQ